MAWLFDGGQVFPIRESLHLTGLSAQISNPALLGFVHVFENWTYSLFFAVAELWGTIVIACVASHPFYEGKPSRLPFVPMSNQEIRPT